LHIRIALLAGFAAFASFAPASLACAADLPEKVTFLSADGKTTLTGYVFKPAAMSADRVAAVVMMHGRSGAYSTKAKGVYDASTLSQRHLVWGRRWAREGYIALMVDGFGPRGYAKGFPRFSYDDRPKELNEVTVRPLDAYGALAYLRTRPDVVPGRIGLQGWSNGGSAALATMSDKAPGIDRPTPQTGFRAAVVFYPACGLKGRFDDGYVPYAPVRVYHGTADEEVSHRVCGRLVKRSREDGGDIEIHYYKEATHSFDDPGRRRQRVAANADATEDVIDRAEQFFARELRGRSE
jgi:dienelactone hydrolase